MERNDRKELENARQKLANELDKLVKVSENLLAPLKAVNENQMAALVMLGFSVRLILLAGRPTANLDQRILEDFKVVIDDICPPLGEVAISKDPCFETSISYASALQQCQNEDPPRDEDECFEAWGPGAQAVMCTMRELEEMRGRLEDIFGRLKPPRPFPWPK
jgi:hypothetical protein